MTAADSRAARALVAADGRTPAPAIDRAPDRADGQSDPNPPKPVARRRSRRGGLLCAVCDQTIAPPSTGYAFVSIGAAQVRHQMHQQWIAHRIKYGTVTNPPPPKVPWHIVHAACHEAPAAGRVYVLPLSKLRTYRQIIDAMLRMSWEHWLADTEHQALIRTILDARR